MKKSPTFLLLQLFCLTAVLFGPGSLYAQHTLEIRARYDEAVKTISILQNVHYVNHSSDTLSMLIFNDWNNAYSSKETALARRFSDEFIRNFHLAKKHERGNTQILAVSHEGNELAWARIEKQPDVIQVALANPLPPGGSVNVKFRYVLKIPDQKFTGYGYGKSGSLRLKNWLITPALFHRHKFAVYSNMNSEDAANAISNYNVSFSIPEKQKLFSDLIEQGVPVLEKGYATYELSGTGKTDVTIATAPDGVFHSFRTNNLEIASDLSAGRTGDIQRALIVDRIVKFTEENIGAYPHRRITVLQSDYDRNPFYGLNQLPSFMSPFDPTFLYEIKFLKTYLNNFLKTGMKLDPRENNYIYDAIQVYYMMKYIDEYYPEMKMMGSVSKYKLLKRYNLTNLPFNGQYSYFYLLMARKNLDQPIGLAKDNLIKFNEQIAGKYRAGLSMRYLSSYIGPEKAEAAISDFYRNSLLGQVDEEQFRETLTSAANKDIDWFFETIVHSRDIIDYKLVNASATLDSITFKVSNRTGTVVPLPVYGVSDGRVVSRQWLEGISKDSILTIPRAGADKIVLNYLNEVPEFNRRNNAGTLRKNALGRKPLKFTVMKDLEDPNYTQILYVPTVLYNLYDGISLGLRFHNKTILDKPFVFDMNPIYSSNTQSLIGNFTLGVNQYNRDSNLYHIRYNVSGSYFHYAPEAAYFKLNPSITFRFREDNYKDNHKQLLLLRNVFVSQEHSALNPVGAVTNYSVFNSRYINTNSEATRHMNFIADIQLSGQFGKTSVEAEYRKLFIDNRQISIRVFAGVFLFNNTDSDYFSFGLDRPTDYLFDYNFYGRSETTGIFSQQLILADGAFKSKISNPFANQWITTANLGFNVWNWVEIYGDLGFVKDHGSQARFVYDNGIRLNLVTDYFELYFPFYSNNGWEIAQPDYEQKIRFVVTIDPRILVNLFTRKWF